MTPYWAVDHIADLGLRIRAESLPQLFIEAAKGFGLLLFGEFPAVPEGWREVEIEAPDQETLLVDFLSEMLALAVVEGLAVVKVRLDALGPSDGAVRLRAGLGFRPVKDLGGLKEDVKAVTYHGLNIAETEKGFEVTVIFDV